MNGNAIPASANRGNHRDSGMRPPRVSHSAAMPIAAPSAPKPIMIRKPQYVTGRLGT